ncbi:UNVERIFIED_CONTAM: hypothetical protein Slati_3061000 [Sesamum latifolium]|uniref:Uncharacterized protein n=1 Tax=Sesamum latifolium TaxID=2727402 RepID=A0AAW2UT16_9LAMI
MHGRARAGPLPARCLASVRAVQAGRQRLTRAVVCAVRTHAALVCARARTACATAWGCRGRRGTARPFFHRFF